MRTAESRAHEHMPNSHLCKGQLAEFEANGFLILPGFFDPAQEVAEIQRGIHGIIGLLLHKHGLQDDRPPLSPGSFDAGYADLIGLDRGIGGQIYDAVKQIPAFLRFCSQPKLGELTAQIRGNALPGIAAAGYGIRIDNPLEERFRANWHQDYTAQFRSQDGLVFWSPLVEVTWDMGPVELCIGSHKLGPLRVHSIDPLHPEKTGAYGLTLEHEAETLAPFSTCAPLSRPGDLLIIDYMTVHRSGQNNGTRSRWSMQLRYFNFLEQSGIEHAWKGGSVAGIPINEVHPGLLVSRSE